MCLTEMKKREERETVVSATRDGSDSDESTDVDELSDGARAEILAISKKMLRRKQREEIIEDAYNRYALRTIRETCLIGLSTTSEDS